MSKRLSVAFIPLLLQLGCSRSNNLLLGEVRAKAGSHMVKVTDCYRTSVPPVTEARGDRHVYRFTPCVDADVVIRDEELIVNGKSYGRLKTDDGVLVDHGVVSVQNPETRRQ
jgi:hypothetical protein